MSRGVAVETKWWLITAGSSLHSALGNAHANTDTPSRIISNRCATNPFERKHIEYIFLEMEALKSVHAINFFLYFPLKRQPPLVKLQRWESSHADVLTVNCSFFNTEKSGASSCPADFQCSHPASTGIS